MMRNCERPRHKQLPEIRAMENPDEEFDIDQHLPNVKQSEYLMNPSAYREVCWDLKKRGAVGETIFHLCLLNATSLHADLAKRLLKFYPKLINDIYMSDEYYGKYGMCFYFLSVVFFQISIYLYFYQVYFAVYSLFSNSLFCILNVNMTSYLFLLALHKTCV